MKTLVLSGTAPIVPSGTGSSCYQGPNWSLTHCRVVIHDAPNCTNIESFGFNLTDRAEIPDVDNRGEVLPKREGEQQREPALANPHWLHPSKTFGSALDQTDRTQGLRSKAHRRAVAVSATASSFGGVS